MRPVVVGIAGGSASGKSTAARGLLARLGGAALQLTHDRYYRSLPAGRAPASWNFDHPDSLETELMVAHLDALLDGHTVRVPRYHFDRHARAPEAEWEPLTPRPVIVVEGILVLADPSLRARMHHAVFVHAPDDVRLARRIRRDVAERGREVEAILDQYLHTVRPMHDRFVAPSAGHADLVLDGTEPVERMVDAVLSRLDGVLGRSSGA